MRRAGLAAGIVVVVGAIAAAFASTAIRRETSASSIEARLNAHLSESTNGLYRVRLADSSCDLLRRSFVVSKFALAPDSAAWEARRDAGAMPQIRFSIEADALRLDGIDWTEWLRGRVTIATATIEKPVVRFLLNRLAPEKSPPRPSRMPHELLAELPRALRIDTLAVKNGSLHYSEVARDGARSGTARFEDVWAAVYGLTSDPKPGAAAPCRIDVRMLLQGEGATDLTLEYDLASPRLDLKYRGCVGRMPASAFNEMLVDLEGLRVNAGRLDSTWFDFRVTDDAATGKVQVLYHDLDTEIVDKVTLERGFKERFQTFANNAFRIEASNPRGGGDPAVVVSVRRERTPHENFFRFLWVIVREGLLETLGV